MVKGADNWAPGIESSPSRLGPWIKRKTSWGLPLLYWVLILIICWAGEGGYVTSNNGVNHESGFNSEEGQWQVLE